MRLQGCQIRMARAALRLSLTELAECSGVSEKTIRRCEAVDGQPPVADHSLGLIGKALNDRGVRFMEGRGRQWGPGCILDWNPEMGDRPEVHALIAREGDPDAGGAKLPWPPLPRPKPPSKFGPKR